MTPEQRARIHIDTLLQQAGWHVCDLAHANIHAARGVALREFPLNAGYGFADYLLYIDGKAAGVIEAKKEGTTPADSQIVEHFGQPDFDPEAVKQYRNRFAFRAPDHPWLLLDDTRLLTKLSDDDGEGGRFAAAIP